ncbi:50S ribosomal protein L24 [candidate division WWE3 bacterium RIFOXYC1_FULL_40_10]|uniref:Large ribosomal subunit protein uL24 n=1 Tax=candidate division WWE3 bacterium RIFOXYA2_FULL_46_9 TaxID=1802636 RepID=A0A1F4VYI2_UNCKA|nr:MAG: 50S ribosomal protein L24 [candidate division WWE3 bacterium RIFOXYB1_FULL_40_22]OGC61858.1 MAG: 50S ribosomal protein L24 [candidate division WWE3 bacterium RIFOXYA1_FULL_40_11]OGC62224.1 MAG: 50S ribosomal protein L24 [candidate division WWE3 bacterium RIFOXYA2_FULL_46_9]OGC64330.1 MAG: 50S ribosomal protein L24 [candidate division WWE3 bacterium RIFOXYB2_FULL_41_6]OGC66241.1 MAG: 50S ribosomal protein L24 [candidate division WWE3 bacterium RIFOXYC1_FULL_40_10]OGC67847.1 MAG: 50S rib
MKIRKDDMVKILSGKDKGKVAKVLKSLPSKGKIVVEAINMVKRHIKPGAVSKEGGIVSVEKAISVSNVMYYAGKDKKAVRIGYKIIDGKKYRINKVTGDTI